MLRNFRTGIYIFILGVFWARPENGQGGLTDPNYTKVLLTFKNEFVPGDTYPFLTQNWLRRITQLNNTCSFIDIQSTDEKG